jgi:hypothetical protein
MTADGTEQELDELMDLLVANVPHPEVSNLIFHPAGGVELTPDEVVDNALNYRATRLDGPGHA